ncbi:hypothetical protein ACHAXA_000150 [Cyclostephanos tholiformis]|uniref:peptidylprolyl isomerase n=1 Tax=Cyclostephanos tholiformis TaxID=382380 RepID=A0ABD3SCM8_9STRA
MMMMMMMNVATIILSVLFVVLPNASGFANINNAMRPVSYHPHRSSSSLGPTSIRHVVRPCDGVGGVGGGLESNAPYNKNANYPPSSSGCHRRREAIARGCRIAAVVAAFATASNPAVTRADIEGVVTIPQSSAPPTSTASNIDGKSVTLFKTRSGLQYIDIIEGDGPYPKYGNFVSIAYRAYIKLPDARGESYKLDEFDSDRGYLIKHGNGRTVPGLDEGLHTMRVGGKRRIIVPPKLGYVTSGLGPIPVGPYGRWKLNRLIDRMVELGGGNVIFDVEVKSIIEDEADQGYYTDESLSPEDFDTLRRNIEASQQAARASRET